MLRMLKSLHGANSARGWEFAPSGKASLKVTRWLDLGLEYYSTLGQVGNFERFGNQQHTLMPAIDLNVSPRWEINFGVGRASTTAPTPGWSNLLSAAAFNRWKFARMNGCTSSCSFR